MSVAVRQALAAAASTVPDVKAHPYYVQSTKAGSAFVRLDRVDYPNPFGGLRTWNVVVLLPQDMAQAEKWLDERLPALVDAIGSEMAIRSATPQQLELPTHGVVLCVFITGQREE